MNNKRIHRDYAYTLQGWLKDINGYRVDINSTGVYDIGEDGSTTNYVNKRFGRDLFSSMIQFYQTDYSPISGNNYFNLVSTNSIDLYNGNISAISVGIKNLDPLLKSYCYDKINRIKVMTSAGLNNNVWGTLSNLFGSTYSYDFNGNIDTLIRYDQNGNLLHNIRYTYSADRNRLSSINVSGTGIGSSSYQYDALGNLIRDNNENINVTWNLIGKVKSVQTPNNMLSFAYNPFGQRQIKRTASDSTYYIHDATGNVMSIYVKDYPKITAKERPIYGSSRLGIMNKEVEFNLTGIFLSKSNSTIGIKEYELSDHLGNVSVVVLDRKECTNSVFKPIIKTYTDYYPFGYPISSRTDNFDYRYGFNGQDGDNEIYGDKKYYSYEFRNYDSRIGRWWGIDSYFYLYNGTSPYSFVANNPNYFIDVKGKIKKDINGNIIATDYYKSGISINRMAVNYNVTKNSDGSSTSTEIIVNSRRIIIYTDKGTPVEADLLINYELRTIIYDENGKIVKQTNETIDNAQVHSSSNCHGYSMAGGKVWINDPSAIINDEYQATNLSDADIIVLNCISQDQGVNYEEENSHSGKVNKDGTISYDSGRRFPKENASIIEFYTGWDVVKTQFLKKNSNSAAIDVNGEVINGVVIISKSESEKINKDEDSNQ